MLSMESAAPTNRQAVVLKYFDEYDDVEAALKEVRTMRKELRGRIQQTVNLRGFDLSRKMSSLAGEDREAQLREFMWIMAAIGKPITTQVEPLDDGTLSDHQRRVLEDSGHEAGKGNTAREANPWNVGSEAYQAWDSGWLSGREALSDNLTGPLKRPRGRPKGSRNKANGLATE